MSTGDSEHGHKTLDKVSTKEENHHSTLLEDKMTPYDISNISPLNLDETSDITQSVMSSDDSGALNHNLKDLRIDLSRVKIETQQCEDVTPPKSPKTPHSEKLVSGVVTDHRFLELENESDEVLTVETNNISK